MSGDLAKRGGRFVISGCDDAASQFAGLLFDVDISSMSDIELNGNNLSRCDSKDGSSSLIMLQNTAGAQPVYDIPVTDYNNHGTAAFSTAGTDDTMAGGALFAGAGTYVWVGQVDSVAAVGSLFAHGYADATPDYLSVVVDGTGRWSIQTQGQTGLFGLVADPAVGVPTIMAMTAQNNGTGGWLLSLQRDLDPPQVRDFTSGIYGSGMPNVQWCARIAGGTLDQHINATAVRFLSYDRVLSAGEMTSLIQSLKTKYGI